eukprot:6027766-Alexandrium_andersonii.AAC.1
MRTSTRESDPWSAVSCIESGALSGRNAAQECRGRTRKLIRSSCRRLWGRNRWLGARNSSQGLRGNPGGLKPGVTRLPRSGSRAWCFEPGGSAPRA